MVIQVDDITLRYGSMKALDAATASFTEGAMGLLGPNGAGKTSLLKVLLGFLQPTSGRAEVLGMDVARRPLDVRQAIGYMPEVDCHIPGMNAVQLCTYAGELCGMPRIEAIQRAHEALYYANLGEARYRPIETYSTGMKQRVKLAQASMARGSSFSTSRRTGWTPRGASRCSSSSRISRAARGSTWSCPATSSATSRRPAARS